MTGLRDTDGREGTTRVERARALWNESDRLRERARLTHAEADALDRAAERLHRMAAAIQDGRDDDLVHEALSVR